MLAIIEGKGGISHLLKKRIKNSILIKPPLKPDIDAIIKFLKNKGIKRVVFAGKFEKKMVYKTNENLLKNDDEFIIKVISERFRKEGIRVLNPKKWLSEFIAKKGYLTSIKPSNKELDDIRLGIMYLKKLNKIGSQVVCLRNGIVIAIEALEGTDEVIKRAGRITSNFVVVKYGKKGREIPVVGERTIRVMKKQGARVLAIRSNVVLILPKAIQLAEKSNISLVGV